MKKLFILTLTICLFIPYINIFAEETNTNSNEENATTNNEKQTESNSNNTKKEDNKTKKTSELSLAEKAKSAIMIEATTGEILFEKNSKESMPMASMTKMMTLLLIMENIENGNLKWDEQISASEYAASMGGSQIFLQPGEKMTVDDLVKGICIGSGNDASVAMAERIGGTEEEFVKMMNKKAKSLGLKNTNFVNACGLDAENHYSSAYDMAMIAKELVKYDKILKYTGTYEEYLRKNSDNPFWLVNTNKLVRYYSGVDGLKTGYTETAGYCITTTAKKNNLRLITVVMGEPSSTIRNSETTSMLDYGFNTYEVNNIMNKNKKIATKKIELGKDRTINIVPKDEINILNKKISKKRNITYKYDIKSIKAPIKKGDRVGKINIIEDGKIIYSTDATVDRNVKKANILTVYLRNLLDIFNGTI